MAFLYSENTALGLKNGMDKTKTFLSRIILMSYLIKFFQFMHRKLKATLVLCLLSFNTSLVWVSYSPSKRSHAFKDWSLVCGIEKWSDHESTNLVNGLLSLVTS